MKKLLLCDIRWHAFRSSLIIWRRQSNRAATPSAKQYKGKYSSLSMSKYLRYRTLHECHLSYRWYFLWYRLFTPRFVCGHYQPHQFSNYTGQIFSFEIAPFSQLLDIAHSCLPKPRCNDDIIILIHASRWPALPAVEYICRPSILARRFSGWKAISFSETLLYYYYCFHNYLRHGRRNYWPLL